MSSVPPSNPPGGGGYAPPPGGGYVTPPPAAAASGSTNVLAIISLVVGILGLLSLCLVVLGFIPLLLGIIGAVLGFVARNQIKANGQGGSGLAVAGIAIGIIAALLGLLELAGLAAIFSNSGAIATAVNDAASNAAATLTATAP